MIEPVYIPEKWDEKTLIQVRDGELMLFRKPPSRESKSAEQLTKQRERILAAKKGSATRRGAYCGAMTPGARKRMTKAVTLMCQCTKPKWITNPVNGRAHLHRLSFLTLNIFDKKNLTAADCHKKVLHHFLQWLRRTKNVKLYIWKAEINKRGQIHYHVIFPDFIPFTEIRKVWNKLQREAGILDNYIKKFKNTNANAGNIHELRNVKKTAKYVVKELGKDIDAKKLAIKKELARDLKNGHVSKETAAEIFADLEQDTFFTKGKVWDCSDNLSGMSYFTMPLTIRQDLLIRSWIEQKLENCLFGEWWASVDMTNNSPPDFLNTQEQKLLKNHLDIITNGGKKYLREIALYLN